MAAATDVVITRLAQPAGRDVYAMLRSQILDGALSGGDVINQVAIARTLGVSRTPVREAVRMLEAEGLVEAEPQRRARVTLVEAGEIDSVYATRILTETLALAISSARFTVADAERGRLLVEVMGSAASVGDIDGFEAAHRQFHAQLVRHAPASLRQTIEGLSERTERYRRLYLATEPRAFEVAGHDHAAILAAVERGDRAQAADRLAFHLARTAVALIRKAQSDAEATAVREALRLVTREEQSPEEA